MFSFISLSCIELYRNRGFETFVGKLLDGIDSNGENWEVLQVFCNLGEYNDVLFYITHLKGHYMRKLG